MAELPPDVPFPASPPSDLISGGAGWLIHHLPMGVLVQDAEARLLDANPAGLAILGLAEGDLPGLSSIDHRWELLDERGQPLAQAEQPAMRALVSGQTSRAVLSLRARNGTRRWLKVTAIPQFAEVTTEGPRRPQLVYSVFEDVTDSYMVQLNFERSEQRYRALVMATSQYVWTNSPEGYMTSEQPDWAALTGQTYDEYKGYGWAAAVHPDDSDRTVQEWQAAVAARSRFETEHRVRTVSGEYRSFSVRAIPLLSPQGELLEWVGLHTDITPLRTAEAALKAVNAGLEAQVEERSRAFAELTRFNSLLLDSAGEGIFGLDPDGRARFANPAAATLLGYSVDELEGASMHALIHSRHADGTPYPEAECPISQMIRSPEVGSRRVDGEVFWRKDGSAMPVEYVVTSLPADPQASAQGDNTRHGVVLLFQDVTAQVRARAELERAIHDLERSNRELEQFAYVSSHDLQEPLRTVGSYAELLARRYRGQLDARADQYIDFMQDAVSRMRQLINDLLSYSRIGRSELSLQPVALDGVLQDVAGSLAAVLNDTGTDLSWHDLPVVQGNTVQLSQLLSNLITNAVKFRQDGVAPVIRVRSQAEDRDAHLTVSDNGIGIAPEFQERIFGLFQRLHRREEYEGTGLGLAICRKIAQGMGGEIWLESEVGAGTTVHLRLPLASGQEPSL